MQSLSEDRKKIRLIYQFSFIFESYNLRFVYIKSLHHKHLSLWNVIKGSTELANNSFCHRTWETDSFVLTNYSAVYR